MNIQKKYEQYLSIILDENASNRAKNEATEKIINLFQKDMVETDTNVIKNKLENKFQGILPLVIDGKEVECNLEQLLEDALQYYGSIMPNPELYILTTDIEILYSEIHGIV